jgi:hypothetical protein
MTYSIIVMLNFVTDLNIVMLTVVMLNVTMLNRQLGILVEPTDFVHLWMKQDKISLKPKMKGSENFS